MTETAFSEITDLLGIYFDGLYHSDSSLLARAFHPDARYVTATGDDLLHLDMPAYFRVVDNRPSPAGRNEPRQDVIREIQIAGPTTAFARVNCAIGDRYFTDFLSLIRTDGEWRIISKVFHYDLTDS
tara:strand:- start:309 stop:689 length:381 start_codon:yes stop_codon:yes gene_type:complete